jgi:hypothetical protein
MDDDAFLDALLGIPPPRPPSPAPEAPPPPKLKLSSFRVIVDTHSTIPGNWTCRQRYGGYVPPPIRVEATLVIPEAPVEFDPLRPGKLYDASLYRMKLRAADKRDTKIKNQKRI